MIILYVRISETKENLILKGYDFNYKGICQRSSYCPNKHQRLHCDKYPPATNVLIPKVVNLLNYKHQLSLVACQP